MVVKICLIWKLIMKDIDSVWNIEIEEVKFIINLNIYINK